MHGWQCLLPLANTPLIEYTLEFLAMSGVTEIYIYCGAHTTEIERYIQLSKWHPLSSASSPFTTLEIVKTTARSVGDAMRDLDSRDLITGDFLLVHGDLVSNLPIEQALRGHRERRAKDKNAIMTVVLRDGGLGAHRTKAKGITPVFVIEPSTKRCLHYEEMHPLQANRYVNIDPDLLSSHPEMEIRTDLIDCGIDICTPEVLALWAESFDYENTRRHFLHGVLKDYELNGQTIHTQVVENYYAARVANLQAYDAVSKDVLGRWTYPLVPDSNLVADQTYKFERGGLCKENGVVLARTCKTGKRTVLGRDTSIGGGSSISNSIIGRRCQIGKDVVIENAYIWDDVSIGDGSKITRSIIANEVSVGKNCTISPGALLSYSVRISDNTTIKPNARITRAKRTPTDNKSARTSNQTEPILVGHLGEGYEFIEEDASDEEADDPSYLLNNTLIYSTAHLNLSQSSISTLSSTPSSPLLSPHNPRSRLSSFADSITSDTTPADRDAKKAEENFHHDAVSGLLDALTNSKDFDSAKLEFMGLRLSNDADDHQIRKAVAAAFVKRITQIVLGEQGVDAVKATARVVGIAGVKGFLLETAVGVEKRLDDQSDFLNGLIREVVHGGKKNSGTATTTFSSLAPGNVMAAICQRLYVDEICDEEGFLAWWAQSEIGEKADDSVGELGDVEKVVREKVLVFIEWLREADEEDSEEDSEDEESE